MSRTFNIPSFDEALDAHEKGGKEAQEREDKKRAKYHQLKTQVDDFDAKLYNANKKFKDSLFDSSIDSVIVSMDIDLLLQKKERAESLMKSLFPNGLVDLPKKEEVAA